MLLCNEYRTAYKTVGDPAAADRFRQAGWHEVAATDDTDTAAPPAPTANPPKYKGRLLSWYVQCGTVSDLRAVLRHVGIACDRHLHKAQMQALLKQYLRAEKEATGFDGT